MGIKLSVLILLFFYFGNLNSQSKVQDTSYIRKFPDKITARLFGVNTSNSLSIQGRNDNLNYELLANKEDRIGASIAFRSIVLSYSFAPNFMSKNRDNKDSKLFNLNLRTFLGQWMQTIDFY
jgi:hypothetical protein